MYREKSFSEKPVETVLQEIQLAAQTQPHTKRIFLADGDALYRDTETLLKILQSLHNNFPQLERVSSYALPNNLLTKTAEELLALREAGLTLLYYGVETGSAPLLKCITKGATPSKMQTGLQKATDTGFHVSATVILGLGGQHYWQEHIEQTATLINALNLTYVSTLQLTLDASLEEEYQQKFQRQEREFLPQSDQAILNEQILLISLISPEKSVIFRSNHASNALPLKGVLPEDKDTLLSQLNDAANGATELIPEWLRGL